MTKTYKQVVDIFENIAARHKMVGSFINNTPFQVNGNTNLFPVVAVYPGLSTISQNAYTLRLKFFVMDLLTSDYSNEKEVLSDTLQICKDFIDELSEGNNVYGIYLNSSNISAEPFAENFQSSENTDIADIVAGWYLDLYITVPAEKNNCIIPFNEYVVPTTPTPPVCPSGVTLFDIVEYVDDYHVTIDSPISFFRSQDIATICNSDSSDGSYNMIDGSYVTGGTQGYLFTFESETIIPASITNLGKLYF